MKVAMYDLEGYFLELFECENIYQLEIALKHRHSGIAGCINGKSLSSEGRQFRVVTEYNNYLTRIGDVSQLGKGHSYKPVHKYYKGKYICTYYNVNKAAEVNNLEESGISRTCNGILKTSGGFQWEWASKELETI